jgi:hypothetical protein
MFTNGLLISKKLNFFTQVGLARAVDRTVRGASCCEVYSVRRLELRNGNPGIRRHCSGKLSPAMQCRSCSGKKKSHLISAQTREIKLDMFEHEKRVATGMKTPISARMLLVEETSPEARDP